MWLISNGNLKFSFRRCCVIAVIARARSYSETMATSRRGAARQAVPSQCEPYSLYVQLSRCPSLDGVMLLSKARERDIVGNTVPETMAAAERWFAVKLRLGPQKGVIGMEVWRRTPRLVQKGNYF